MPALHPAGATDGAASRRRYLAALGSGIAAATAGCTAIPGTGPEQLSTEPIEESADRVAWQFPATEGDDEGFGYAAVRFDGRNGGDPDASALRFRLNASVGLDADYTHDRYRFRLWVPPAARQREGEPAFYVEPPGQWEGFRAHYERRAGRRELVVEHRGVETRGTVLTPVVLDTRVGPPPEALAVAFTGRFSRTGVLGDRVAVEAGGRLPFGDAE